MNKQSPAQEGTTMLLRSDTARAFPVGEPPLTPGILFAWLGYIGFGTFLLNNRLSWLHKENTNRIYQGSHPAPTFTRYIGKII